MADGGAVSGSDEIASGITVGGLAASGGALLQGVHVPDPAARITVVDIFDPTRRHDLAAAALVLGVGLDPLSPATAQLLADAAELGVAAVALSGHPEEVMRAAPAAGDAVALFAVTPGAGWAHVHTIVRTLTTTPIAARELATPYQDLFAVANTVAASVGGPVTIEDVESRVLAFSSPQEPVDERRRETILGRATPDVYQQGMRQAGVYRRINEGVEPVLLPADPAQGLRARLAMAVKAGDDLLGYLWASEGVRPLGDEARRALKDLAPVVALHLLRVIAAGTAGRNRRRDLLSAALDGTWSPDLAVELHLRRGEQLIVACIAPAPAEHHAEETYLSERACQLIEVHLATYRTRGLVTRHASRIYCVLPSGDGTPTYQHALITELLAKLAVSLRLQFRAGIGDAAPVHALRRSRADAEAALRTGQLLEIPEPATYIAQVRDRALLVALRDVGELHPLVDRGSVARMLAHDREHGTVYSQTLRAYLDCHCSIPAAARRLHVHVNTLRYRLTRLTELFGVDLDDPHERLALSMQLWLRPPATEEPGEDDDHPG